MQKTPNIKPLRKMYSLLSTNKMIGKGITRECKQKGSRGHIRLTKQDEIQTLLTHVHTQKNKKQKTTTKKIECDRKGT